ncbi:MULTISPECIES: restriction endonuclease subunit S [unclassified Empedobacter]|uniref:restriction endonuclease subunit S n=1 Tax=unclassified Empedobacter TaxID=2643773 RepID=UPI0025B987EF|nr:MULTISPECIES: restriction endonuclease subunit S [unclassified Empedobacter]
MEWKKVKLKSIFKQYRIEHRVQDDIVYKQVTISKHTGVSFRGEKLGKEIGRKRQFVIDLDLHPHTLMFVRQGVQDGSIGFAPLEVNKCIVTENMPMFSVEDVDVEFIKSYIESSLFKDILNSLSTKGAAQKSIHEKELLEVEILIPESLEDQKAFGKLIKDSTKNSNNISTEITHQLDLIKNLRQAFLREAMQGLLVSNETNDDKTGADLLAEIQAEKAQLVKEKKIKKPKPLAPITEEEMPFDIPENWTWCRVGDLSYSIVPNRDKPKSFTGHIPWITQTNFSEKSFYLDYSLTDKGLSIEETNLYNCRVMPKDSIVMSCVGRFDLVCLLDKPIVANQQLHCFVPFSNLSPKYLAYSIKQFSNLLIDKAIKTTISYINKEKCESIFIPLPPLEIQERIVAKLDELMGYCDALETQVKQSQQTNALLLQQVLREALGA